MPDLEIQDLWKAYNGRPALQGLSLRVRTGELMGLLGPNGAGKTTTLRIVAGLLSFDRGQVRVLGKDVAEDPISYKAQLGYMPEDPRLPDYLSPEEFLHYIGRIRDVDPSRRRKKVDDLLQTFDLGEKMNELIITLSRGMKQRLALACAIMHEPDLIMLDEPLTAVDPAGQHRIKEILRDFASRGHAILVSTHMLDTAERLCDSVTIIHQGRSLATGTFEELRQKAEARESATLEEVFLKLTEEAVQTVEEEEPRRRRFPWGRP